MDTLSVAQLGAATIAALFGLVFGSFGTVLIERIPSGKSIIKPRSRCDYCEHEITWYDNIPVISYLLLRGKCRNCGSRISPVYLFLELATGALFVALSMNISLLNVGMFGLAVVSLPLLVIDLKHQRLPNALTYFATAWALLCIFALGLITSNWAAALIAVACGLIPAAFLLLVGVIFKGGMGLGDVKLALAMGLSLGVLGWQAVAAAFVVAFIAGGLVSAVLLIFKRVTRKAAIPFGPFLLIGTWASLFGGLQLQSVLLSPWGYR